MIAIVTFSCLMTTILAATTTHAPHMHKEQSELENFSFGYEHSTQALIVRSTASCFIWELTSDEKSNIHSNDGMTAVEMRVIKEIDSAYYTVVPKAILHPNIVKSCNIQVKHGVNLRYMLVH